MNTTPETAAAVIAPPRPTLRTRLKAAGVNLSLSLAVLAVALYLILAEWYPDFHFTVDGGWQGVRIMVLVDLVLGPLLTFIVFNPNKARHLIAFDLACIGTAQIAALVWGFYAIHSQRVVAVSYVNGEFHAVTPAPLEIEKYDPAGLAALSDRTPPLVYVAPAANDDEETRKQLQEFVGGLAEWEDPFFFRTFAPHWPEVEAKAVPAEKRAKQSRAFREALPGFLAKHGGTAADYRFFPYVGRYGTCTLAVTPAGEIVGAVGCEDLI